MSNVEWVNEWMTTTTDVSWGGRKVKDGEL
jgi:hypothetical protein